MGRARICGPPARTHAADRSDRERGRELPQCLLHDVAVLAEPGLAAERRLCPSSRRHQQLHRAARRAGDVSEGAAARGIRHGLRRQVAHGREQRRAPSGVRLLRDAQGAGAVFRHRVQLQWPAPREAARLLHLRRHRHRARLAADRSPAETVDADPRPQGDAQLLHAGAEIRTRLRRHPGALSGVGIHARRQAGLDQAAARHLARHLRPALRLAQEVSRRSSRGASKTSRTWSTRTGRRS